MTLTDKCSKMYINGKAVRTGVTCRAGAWTHMMVSYCGGRLRIFKNARRVKTIRRSYGRIPPGGVITLGQESNNARYPRARAMAPGQIGTPQLFSSCMTSRQALGVKTGQRKGNVLSSLNGFRVAGMTNFDTNPNAHLS